MAKQLVLLLFVSLVFAWGVQCQTYDIFDDAAVVVDDVPDLEDTFLAVPTLEDIYATLYEPEVVDDTYTLANSAAVNKKKKKTRKVAPGTATPPVTSRAAGSTIVIDKEGGGDYDTVQAGIDAAPAGTAAARTTVIIKKGTYKEKVLIPVTKPYLIILAEEGAKIIYNKAAKHYKYSPSLAATFSVLAPDTIIKGLTCENDYGWPNGKKGSQAPALWVNADRVAFYDCTFIGHQDTLFAHNYRQYFKNCNIVGSVDYIFGNARALFEDCTYTCINNDDNHFSSVTAHYRQSLDEKIGFVMLRGTIKAELGFPDKKPFLGRVWGPYNTVVFADVDIETKIRPGGWGPMKKTPKSYLKTALCYEYENTGKGAKVPKRVKWAKTDLTSEEKAMYLGMQWIDGSEWVIPPP